MSASKSLDVVGVGACNADLFTYTTKMPVRGETVTGTSFAQGWGGKNHNQSTGVAAITVDAAGGNCIVIVPGANNDVTAEFVESQRHVIESARVVVTQLEVPLAATLRALEIAANSPGTTAIFNPAPADAALPDRIFALSDLVIPNETEASLLSGVQVVDVASAEAAARVLLAKGAKNVIVTLGGQGCLLVPGGGAAAVHVPAPKVAVVDTTGAGDSFIGALAHCIARGDSLVDAVKRAIQCASFSVQRQGTQQSFATKDDIERLGLWK